MLAWQQQRRQEQAEEAARLAALKEKEVQMTLPSPCVLSGTLFSCVSSCTLPRVLSCTLYSCILVSTEKMKKNPLFGTLFVVLVHVRVR